jgi:hypothetical protein
MLKLGTWSFDDGINKSKPPAIPEIGMAGGIA